MLPDDIVIKESQKWTWIFMQDTKQGKRYRYLIYNSQFPSALLRHRTYHVSHKLDFESMQRAASYFWGPMIFPPSDQAAAVQNVCETITDVSLEREDKIVKFR